MIDERIALPRERAPDQYVPWGHNGQLKLFRTGPHVSSETTPAPTEAPTDERFGGEYEYPSGDMTTPEPAHEPEPGGGTEAGGDAP